MNDKLLERIAALETELAALKAEAAKPAPKYKVGDRLIVPVTILQGMDGDGDYYVKHTVTGEEIGCIPESDLLPAAPRLVQADPDKLKDGDEIWIKSKFISRDLDGDIRGVIQWHMLNGQEDITNFGYSASTVYRLEQE